MTLPARTAARTRRTSRDGPPVWLSVFSLATLLTAIPACNLIEAVIGRHAKLSEMVPGGNIGTGELECWLTLEFDRYPDGIDRRDVLVRFESVALHETQAFDWSFIAEHDLIPRGSKFGSGYRANERTSARTDPPLGAPFKVRFPLRAKDRIEDAPSTLWLEAELYWGGRKQSSTRRSLEHVYSRSPNGFF